MGRKRRNIISQGFYHVMSRGNNRKKTFRDDADHERFLSLLDDLRQEFDISIFHYVLMPTHFHLLLRPNADKEHLPSFMQRLKLGYSQYHAKKYQNTGHLWQNPYKHVPITSDAQLFACGNYIEMNPVRAGLVASPDAWRHSSFRFYAFGERNPLVEADPFFPNLGRSFQERQIAYRKNISRTRAS